MTISEVTHEQQPNIWEQTKKQLQLKMTRATYDTWLARTSQVGQVEDDQLTVAVDSAFAKDWLEGRLGATIEGVVSRESGRPIKIVYSILDVAHCPMDEAPNGTGRPAAAERLNGAGIKVELVSFDPTQRGWIQTSNYAVRFWQPIMNLFSCPISPFVLWVTLKSFSFEANKDVWPSIQTLADICADGQRYKILGRAARAGRNSCPQITGALEILEQLGVVYVKTNGQGRQIEYRFRVLGHLPLLTPRQVEQLTPRLQRAHKRWLRQCELDYEEWEQLSIPSFTDPDWTPV